MRESQDIGELGRIEVHRKDGSESFRLARGPAGFALLDFWQWSVSDLVSNATRGRLAEYIVARGVGISTEGVRDEWAAYDLVTDSGLRIEVKSAAYLQSWRQNRLSSISFSVRRSRPWDPETNLLGETPLRSAQVYVFAVLHHQDKRSIDPLDLDQWSFYVLPTSALDERRRSQSSIALASLERLTARRSFAELAAAVREAGSAPASATSIGKATD